MLNYSGRDHATVISTVSILVRIELALQYVSMFIRSTNNTYQIVEQLPDLGWRYNKSYFTATKVGANKDDRYLLSWVCR